MKNLAYFILPVLVACSSNTEKQVQSITYPSTRKEAVVDSLWGTAVEDPYRWLEDDRSEETGAWVKAQNAVTRSFLDSIPYRNDIRDRFKELINYERVSSPFKTGNWYFIYKNDGLQNQDVIYVREGRDGAERVFIDANQLSKDGTVTMNLLGASDDHKYMAVIRNDAGSDWGEIRVMDIATGAETSDVLKWVKFSGASWFGNGFFYSRYPAPQGGSELSAENTFHKIYYHALGTPQENDVLVYENTAAPNMYHWCSVTEDKQYLIVYAATGTDGYECFFKKLEGQNSISAGGYTTLFSGFANKSTIVDHVNGKFLVLTDIDAPKYRLVAIDPADFSKEKWTEILPESEFLLESVSTGGGKAFASYLENANTRVYSMNYDGSNKQAIALPDQTGSAGGFGGYADDTTLFYTFTSFTYPTTIYEYDIATGESTLYYTPKLAFDPTQYESKQVFYKSKDGTEVSMFIVHKKGLQKDGKRPTLLYGYGGFNVSLTPSFSTANMLLLEQGGVYAMANLRGGGEYGEDWHKGGMLTNKQNVFDDFVAAADFLVQEGYTSNDYLAIAGGSNGGLLVGACMTQHPEKFKVAFPAVGVLDMLRYHKFTVGWGWIPEYGCADSTEVDFKNLLSYSPYHNLKKGTAYPATLITTADHDDRVVPAHSFKFAARLQEMHVGPNPVLIRIEENAGHGAGKPIEKILDEQADKWAFMLYNMNFTYQK